MINNSNTPTPGALPYIALVDRTVEPTVHGKPMGKTIIMPLAAGRNCKFLANCLEGILYLPGCQTAFLGSSVPTAEEEEKKPAVDKKATGKESSETVPVAGGIRYRGQGAEYTKASKLYHNYVARQLASMEEGTSPKGQEEMDAALASEVRYGQTVLSTLQLAPVAVEGGEKESGEQYHCYATNTRETMVMFPFTMPVFSDGILIDLSAHMVQTSLDGRNGERRGMDAKALLGKGCLMTREEKAQKLEHALKLIESASFLQL